MIADEDIAEFRAFLYEAKRNTYANPEMKSRKNPVHLTEEFEYSSGAFKYWDRYFGANPFAGQEVVYKDGVPYWSMNYYGLVTDPDADSSLVYAFLKEAMMLLPPELPLRGPKLYVREEWQYTDACEGDIKRFSGKENISKDGKDIYYHLYHGGLVIPG